MAFVLLAFASVAEAATCTLGSCCSTNGYTSSTTTQSLTLASMVQNEQSVYASWLSSTSSLSGTCGTHTVTSGFYTVSGVATFTTYGKIAVGTDYVAISTFSPTTTPAQVRAMAHASHIASSHAMCFACRVPI